MLVCCCSCSFVFSCLVVVSLLASASMALNRDASFEQRNCRMTFEAPPEPFIWKHMKTTHPHEPLKNHCCCYVYIYIYIYIYVSVFMPANRSDLQQQLVDGRMRARPPFCRSAHCVCPDIFQMYTVFI